MLREDRGMYRNVRTIERSGLDARAGRVGESDMGKQCGKSSVDGSTNHHFGGMLPGDDGFQESQCAYREVSKVADCNRAAIYAANDVALCHPVQHGKPEIQCAGHLDNHHAERDRHGAAMDENFLRQEGGDDPERAQPNGARAHDHSGVHRNTGAVSLLGLNEEWK